MAVVKTANTSFTGVRAGVNFVNGEAVCDPVTAARLAAQFGYTVIADVPAPEPTPVPEPTPEPEPEPVPVPVQDVQRPRARRTRKATP